MAFLYKKFISLSALLAVFLLGNMAMIHAIGEKSHKTISHTHDGITESHVVETPDDTESPHCTQTKTDSSTTLQIRDNDDLPDTTQKIIPFYSKPDSEKIETISSDIYLQHYPGSENHFFGHLLVGEKIILV